MYHELVSLLGTAIRGSTAAYDDPEIVKRVTVKILEASSGDCGSDVFGLQYLMHEPLDAVSWTSFRCLFPFGVPECLSWSSMLWLRSLRTSLAPRVRLWRLGSVLLPGDLPCSQNASLIAEVLSYGCFLISGGSSCSQIAFLRLFLLLDHAFCVLLPIYFPCFFIWLVDLWWLFLLGISGFFRLQTATNLTIFYF